MLRFILVLSLLSLWAVGPAARADDALARMADSFPDRGGIAAVEYSLRMHDQADVSSPLIRLRDVATPIGPPSPWWERAGQVVIAMMPVGVDEIVIERQRLLQALAQEASMPTMVWAGSNATRVRYRQSPGRPAVALAASPQAAHAGASDIQFHSNQPNPILQASQQITSDRPLPSDGAHRSAVISAKVPTTSELPPLAPQDSDRIVRLIQFAIDRVDLSLRDAFDIEIDPHQPALRSLAEVRRVDRIEFLDEPVSGIIAAKVYGVTSRQAVEQTVEVEFMTRPMLVVAREAMRRGQIIKASDLTMMPAPRGFPIDSAITEMNDAVDMQVVNVIQKDRPVLASSISRPIVIERGDLVEVHVVGGGVTVATSARSLSRGATGDLIAVETIEPRKKIIARVARAGLVEIFTRPPRVR